MGLIKNTVHYCCVSRDNQILYAYNGGDQSNESLAGLCLEKTPPFHAWYFESIDEFKKAARKNCRGSFTAAIGSINVDDVVSKLIASLERVAAETANNELKTRNSNLAEQSEGVSSTKAPLLGRSSKQEKKRGKDHVVSVRGAELDEHRNSNDRADRCEASSAAETSSQKECVPRRGRSGSHSFEWKWRRLVQIVLAIDAAICLTLFCVWLAICEGIKCTRS
ncbi:hypothetical protein F2Q68_00002248 [Brassica cretica]|uniref:Longin domain-containing protein n=1 Tax=Brassica cretica TaxID=69181 RepID=A0A8S9JI77_BRACR|nr:hypothetical protein F2Q68_00002248 [Brassica cretica]